MPHMKFKVEVLESFVNDAFLKFGFTKEEAATITDVLITADKYGIESHGMQRVSRYNNGIQNGLIDVHAKPEVVFETPVSAVIDGHQGMGQLIGVKAMNMAIEKAKNVGVGIVSVRESNQYGIAGYYAKMAEEQGLIGFSCTNSEAIMVPTFGRKAMLGSNPIAIAAPAEPYPFLFDAATTVVTRGKLEMYRKAGKPIPDGWALDAKGHPTNNSEEVLVNIVNKAGGGIVPLGGSSEVTGSHKGYGWAMVCELFSSIFSQGTTSNKTHINGHGGTCHGFAAIDPKIFGDPKDIIDHLSTFLEDLRESPKAEGAEQIYTHGEKEMLAIKRVEKEGVPVDVNTLVELKQMSDYLGMDFSKYFGDIQIDADSFHSIYSK